MKLRIILFILPLMILGGCKREQDFVFDKNASVRLNEKVLDVRNTLKGNTGGWMIEYYPSSSMEYGGFTIFADFTSDEEVTLTSDINKESIKSHYAVIPETGPILTFNSFNKVIHFFTEPGLDNGGIGADDTGMKGDFEFMILEYSKDTIVLKGKKSGNILRMSALKEDEFTKLSKRYQDEVDFFEYTMGKFVVEYAGKTEDVTFSNRTLQDGSDANSPVLPFRVVPGGLDFYKEVDLKGIKFDKLAYITPSVGYEFGYYTNDAKTIKLVPIIIPLNDWFISNAWGMKRSGHGLTGLNWWTNGRTRFINNGYTLNYVYFGLVSASDRGFYVDMTVGGINSAAYFVYNLNPVNGTKDEVTSTFGGRYNSSSTFKIEYWSNAIIYLVQHLNSKTFKISADRLNKPDVIKLTDKADPNNTIELSLEAIRDPLNK